MEAPIQAASEPCRQRVAYLCPEFILGLLNRKVTPEPDADGLITVPFLRGLPEGAKFIKVSQSFMCPRAFIVTIEHPSFEPIPEDGLLPEMVLMIETVRLPYPQSAAAG